MSQFLGGKMAKKRQCIEEIIEKKVGKMREEERAKKDELIQIQKELRRYKTSRGEITKTNHNLPDLWGKGANVFLIQPKIDRNDKNDSLRNAVDYIGFINPLFDRRNRSIVEQAN